MGHVVEFLYKKVTTPRGVATMNLLKLKIIAVSSRKSGQTPLIWETEPSEI